jgi:hypothetical protein
MELFDIIAVILITIWIITIFILLKGSISRYNKSYDRLIKTFDEQNKEIDQRLNFRLNKTVKFDNKNVKFFDDDIPP